MSDIDIAKVAEVLCVNCGQRERDHLIGPHFRHCRPELTMFGDDDCTFCPIDPNDPLQQDSRP